MNQPPLSDPILPDLSSFIYGTTRLGDEGIPFDERVRVAKEAMDAGVWFHTSHQYGNALEVLCSAFDQDRSRVPRLICKVGGDSVEAMRADIDKSLGPLRLNTLDVAQLCFGPRLAEDFAQGGACLDELRRLRDEGKVTSFVVEVFPWTAAAPLRAWQAGHAKDLIGACIFYFNPLQRFVTNPLWNLIRERNIPVIAMRSVAGGDVHRLRDVPGAAWKEYLQHRAAQVAPIYERSGVASWVEFAVRFVFSYPQVRATVGSTARSERLSEFLRIARAPEGRAEVEPLSSALRDEMASLQADWSEQVDVHAEPWSM